MKLNENRVDPSELSSAELDQLQPILDLANHPQRLHLKSSDGAEYPLPEPLFEALVKIVHEIRQGKAILILPEDETFTTQAAANYLGMSRQHFVTLIESGQIPFHRVGSHRRVYFKDLKDYERNRDKERRTRLNRLFTRLQDEGLYGAELKPDAQ